MYSRTRRHTVEIHDAAFVTVPLTVWPTPFGPTSLAFRGCYLFHLDFDETQLSAYTTLPNGLAC